MITKLFLKIIESQSLPGDQKSKVVEKPIFRIGRDQDNDWIIPSPDRLISRHHCVIEHINNTFTVSDLSKNGVFINNSTAPIGLGNSGVLNDGDILILPGIKISVKFTEDQTSPADPFLALLPARENSVPVNNGLQETISSPALNLNQPKSEPYDFLKDRANLPILDNQAQTTATNQPWQSRVKPNFDRLPAERDSFRAALPKTVAIPEDWYKEDDINTQPQTPLRAGIDTSTSLTRYDLLPTPTDLQRKLLLELIAKFSEIERSISISSKSDLASTLNEQKLNSLEKKDFDTALALITQITQRYIKQSELRRSPASEISREVSHLSSNDIIDQILQKNSEVSEEKKPTDTPLTGGDINELE